MIASTLINSPGALNPMDAIIGASPFTFARIFPDCPLEETPLVLGEDLAGEVVGIGSSVTTFNIGDKV